jgi:hypothetical protein
MEPDLCPFPLAPLRAQGVKLPVTDPPQLVDDLLVDVHVVSTILGGFFRDSVRTLFLVVLYRLFDEFFDELKIINPHFVLFHEFGNFFNEFVHRVS